MKCRDTHTHRQRAVIRPSCIDSVTQLQLTEILTVYERGAPCREQARPKNITSELYKGTGLSVVLQVYIFTDLDLNYESSLGKSALEDSVMPSNDALSGIWISRVHCAFMVACP